MVISCLTSSHFLCDRIFLLTLASAILVSVGMLALAVYALVISFNNFQDIGMKYLIRVFMIQFTKYRFALPRSGSYALHIVI